MGIVNGFLGWVGRQGRAGEGEGSGRGEKAAVFREELPRPSRGLGAPCQRGECLLHLSQLPGDSVPAAAEAFLCSFIIQHVLAA